MTKGFRGFCAEPPGHLGWGRNSLGTHGTPPPQPSFPTEGPRPGQSHAGRISRTPSPRAWRPLCSVPSSPASLAPGVSICPPAFSCQPRGWRVLMTCEEARPKGVMGPPGGHQLLTAEGRAGPASALEPILPTELRGTGPSRVSLYILWFLLPFPISLGP